MKDLGPFPSFHQFAVIPLGFLALKPNIVVYVLAMKFSPIYLKHLKGFFFCPGYDTVRHPTGPDTYRRLCFSGVLSTCVSIDYTLGSASPKTEGCWTPYKDFVPCT